MGIHLVAVVKLPLLHWFKLSPLFWPFNLYLPLVRHLPRMCNTISTASSLLAFRLRQILAQGPHHRPNGQGRMERAFHLFIQELLSPPARLRHGSLEEASFHAFVSLAI
uniref:Uncharacterized protein n=1 Tax=Nelumbo nucifera TaxID=4432 RepID=A0A822Z9U0_NELNU|nr:TPA_asm: hypothetical protein HUJ06_015663 [Nelumbo nucifera]